MSLISKTSFGNHMHEKHCDASVEHVESRFKSWCIGINGNRNRMLSFEMAVNTSCRFYFQPAQELMLYADYLLFSDLLFV